MAGVAKLKTHIIQYSKTREVYAAYKKSRHKKEFLAEHGAEIAQHEACLLYTSSVYKRQDH